YLRHDAISNDATIPIDYAKDPTVALINASSERDHRFKMRLVATATATRRKKRFGDSGNVVRWIVRLPQANLKRQKQTESVFSSCDPP
ncbi:MAG: hypothetical protein MUF87_16955, partial [Anaerolineae bacterium]|nr:hypothetical protein [Anaerolineae bacterium]